MLYGICNGSRFESRSIRRVGNFPIFRYQKIEIGCTITTTAVQSDRATPRRQTQIPQNLHPCRSPADGNLDHIQIKNHKQKRSDTRNTSTRPIATTERIYVYCTRQFVETPTGCRSRRALYDEDRTRTQTTDITIQRRVKYTSTFDIIYLVVDRTS